MVWNLAEFNYLFLITEMLSAKQMQSGHFLVMVLVNQDHRQAKTSGTESFCCTLLFLLKACVACCFIIMIILNRDAQYIGLY